MSLLTDWLCIATSGPTIDGREMKAQWLEEAAESYDTSVYTAVIWPAHYRYYSLGTVEDLKVETADNKVKLFARLRPNQYLIQMNKADQSLFSSIEVVENFAGEGHAYMYGLAVTDSPASLGTDRLEFTKNVPGDESLLFGNAEEFAFTSKPSLFDRLFKKPGDNDKENNSGKKAMDEKQFNSIMGAIDEQNKRFEKLEGDFKEFSASKEKVPGKEPDPKDKTEPGNKAGDEKFNSVMDAFKKQGEKLDKLGAEFEALKKETTVTPDPAPDAANGSEAFI